MKIIHSEKKLCTCCMEVHDIMTVLIEEKAFFKNIEVRYEAEYYYCDQAEEFYMDEEQIRKNDILMKDAYRKEQGLLTSEEIKDLRIKYNICQKELCVLLGWGEKTITRYESHQVQDKAHDTILRKISLDPEWFLELLEGARTSLISEAYRKAFERASKLYAADEDYYLKKAIEAKYAEYYDNKSFHGNTELSLKKVVDMIRYFAASSEVTALYKVKLMKLMWYADALSYKERGVAITGLIYQSLPMGAVPLGHDSIIHLKGVPCEEVDMGEVYAYHFVLKNEIVESSLTTEDKKILDKVIGKLGRMSKSEIVAFMHREQAYIETMPRDIISFQYAESLKI